MTREEVILNLTIMNNTVMRFDDNYDFPKATVMAIKSLVAWDNVLIDLDNAKEDYSDKYGFDGGIQAAREIIKKHMGAL